MVFTTDTTESDSTVDNFSRMSQNGTRSSKVGKSRKRFHSMLIGQYEAKVADKNQTSLPKRFREELGDKLIVTKGFENCLIVVSEENWKTLLEGTEGKPFTSKSARELQRYLLGNANYVELDTKGRFVLPEYLRNFAKIETEIVFVGIQRFVEIWDKKSWDEHQNELSGKIESIAERLSGEES